MNQIYFCLKWNNGFFFKYTHQLPYFDFFVTISRRGCNSNLQIKQILIAEYGTFENKQG